MRPDDCLIFDGGDFCHFGRSYLPALKPKRWLNVSSLGMLGSSLPSALAAKVAYPDSRVFVLSGDGAFGFNAMEFDTAVRHQLNIVEIIGNDSAWGIDRQIQLGLYGRPVATDLLQTRYDQLVEGLGGYGEFVERAEDLAAGAAASISQRQTRAAERRRRARDQPARRGRHRPAQNGGAEVRSPPFCRGVAPRHGRARPCRWSRTGVVPRPLAAVVMKRFLRELNVPAVINPSRRSLLADPEDLIIELGELFEVGSDDLGFHHQIFVDSKLGKSLFQSRARRRAAELLGEEFHAAIRR